MKICSQDATVESHTDVLDDEEGLGCCESLTGVYPVTNRGSKDDTDSTVGQAIPRHH